MPKGIPANKKDSVQLKLAKQELTQDQKDFIEPLGAIYFTQLER